MRPLLAAVLALMLWPAGMALAEVPADVSACNALADKLAEEVENRELDKASTDKIGAFLTTMMGQCEASQLAEAGATADQVRQVMPAQ